jgi:CDP-6-deoxy-D-xylo-4-hexulose-3-dehydrase
MYDNITDTDINELIDFLKIKPIPKLTNGPKVIEFEKKWSEWLGVKHSVLVNSGSSANQLTMLGLKYQYGKCDIIVPPLTWVSDIASVLQNGHNPIFVDINLNNLSFNITELKKKLTPNTRAIFLTHVLGLNGLTDELLDLCNEKNILLIEDVCESHGTTFKNRKVGSYGFASNFSFYFAHHMSTIEGGVVCTNDDKFYQLMRSFRSHGMLRECTDENFKKTVTDSYMYLNKDFIFLSPAYNFRSTEINAVIGLSQLKNLDNNNEIRRKNFNYFISKLDKTKYFTEFNMEGQCNYAFIVILKDGNLDKRNLVEKTLSENKIEFRRGCSGGGNQTLQPYMKSFAIDQKELPVMNHVHSFSWYIGNYPQLELEKIDRLCSILNNV